MAETTTHKADRLREEGKVKPYQRPAFDVEGDSGEHHVYVNTAGETRCTCKAGDSGLCSHAIAAFRELASDPVGIAFARAAAALSDLNDLLPDASGAVASRDDEIASLIDAAYDRFNTAERLHNDREG